MSRLSLLMGVIVGRVGPGSPLKIGDSKMAASPVLSRVISRTRPRRASRSAVLLCGLVALLSGPAPGRAQESDEKAGAEKPSPEKPSPDKVARSIDAFHGAGNALARARARRAVLELGPAALDTIKEIAGKEEDAKKRASLERISVQLLAAKFVEIILERQKTGLIFDGQYDDLKKDGPLAARALRLLLDDETTEAAVRLGTINALADVADASFLPRIRELESDPLLPNLLRDELGALIAILGDTSRFERRLRKLERSSRSKNRDLSLGAYLELSNLYYKIRRYDKATRCYERILKLFTQVRETLKLKKLPPEHPLYAAYAAYAARFSDRVFALHSYNAACSYSLAGKIEESRDHMKTAVKLDPMHYDNMSLDGDLKNLRESEGYAKFKRELAKMLQAESI